MGVEDKVREIFSELVGSRASALEGGRSPDGPAGVLASALGNEHPAEQAHDIAFHLTDWNSDARGYFGVSAER